MTSESSETRSSSFCSGKRSNPGESYRWLILGLVWFCVMAYAVLYQSIPPILGMVVSYLHISYAQAGGLMSLFSLPRLFLSIPGGALSDRYGEKRVGRVGLLFLVGGGVVSLSATHYWVIASGRLLSGFGTVVLNVVFPKVLTSWFRTREIGLAMGIFNTAVPLGFMVSMNFFGSVGERFGWRGPIGVGVAACALAFLSYLKFYRSREGEERTRHGHPGLYSGLGRAGLGIWWVAISWAFFNAAIMSFLTYAPDYFEAQGYEISKAGRLASYPMWASLVLSPVAGVLIDRIRRKNLLLVSGPAGMILLFLMIPRFPDSAALLTLLIGVFIALFPPTVFALPAEILPVSLLGFGFGVISTFSGVGGVLGPFVAGWLRDVTGNYGGSFIAMAVLSAFSALAVLPLWSRLAGRR